MDQWCCLVCEKSTYVKRLTCCQSQSESKYAMCKPCVDKCEICPICRSIKQWSDHEIILYTSDMEFEKWRTINLYFSAYKYLFDLIKSKHHTVEEMLSILVELEEEVLLPIDILPDNYSIELMDGPI